MREVKTCSPTGEFMLDADLVLAPNVGSSVHDISLAPAQPCVEQRPPPAESPSHFQNARPGQTARDAPPVGVGMLKTGPEQGEKQNTRNSLRETFLARCRPCSGSSWDVSTQEPTNSNSLAWAILIPPVREARPYFAGSSISPFLQTVASPDGSTAIRQALETHKSTSVHTGLFNV